MIPANFQKNFPRAKNLTRARLHWRPLRTLTCATSPSECGESAEYCKICEGIHRHSRPIHSCRYDGTQEWSCPNIRLPPNLAKCRSAFEEFSARARNRHSAEWQPVYSECRVELYFNKKKISITCDAVVATILSLFETPETVVRASEIELKTGVKGQLLFAVMEQLCMKRPREGMGTGLLQVSQRCHTALHVYQLTSLVWRRSTKTKTRPIGFTPSEHCVCNRFSPSHASMLPCCLPTLVLRFEFKGRDPKIRIETPSRVIHVLKTPVSHEITAMQKIQIRSAVMRVIKRYGTSPPQNVGHFIRAFMFLQFYPARC
jgi:hypothetical protein